MKVIIYGAAGHMGQNLIKLIDSGAFDMETAAYVSRSFSTDPSSKKYSRLADFEGDADVLIDFSNHEAVREILDYCTEKKLPAVIATTGHTEEEKELIKEASKVIPVFFAANMSIGIAVMADLVRRAAMAFPDADIEIVEAHHNRKVDVPSGTALMLAESVRSARPEASFNIGRHENGKRTKEEIGIHSLRLGNVVGMHEILITTGRENITLKHEAFDRALFAEGALRAAEFISGKPAGLYGMKDMLA